MTLSFCSSWTQQIANPDLYLLHMVFFYPRRESVQLNSGVKAVSLF